MKNETPSQWPVATHRLPRRVAWLAVACAAVALGAACPPKKPAAAVAPVATLAHFARQAPGKSVAILYTASVEGYVEPCGCTAEPLGGVARLVALLKEAREAYGERVLFVDAGDLLFERATDNAPADLCQTEARANLLLETYAHAGLSATVLGARDDTRGAAFHDALLARNDIPMLSVVPPRAPQAGARTLPSIMRSVGSVRVGVTAIRLDAGVDDDRAVAELQSALAREVALLRNDPIPPDAIVCLAQTPRDITKRVLRDVVGVDVVIQGRDPGDAPTEPERLGAEGPLLVSAGRQAQHAGVVELHLDGRVANTALLLDDRAGERTRRQAVLSVRASELRRQVEQAPEGPRRDFLAERQRAADDELAALGGAPSLEPLTGPHVLARAIPLRRGDDEDAEAARALARYAERIPQLTAQCEEGAVCPLVPPDASTYVGMETCKKCHAAAVFAWAAQGVTRVGQNAVGVRVTNTLGHSHAWRTLVDGNKTRDRTCVGCHSAGFNQIGGPCKTADIEKRGLTDVQCEACHGPGSRHAATGAKDAIVGAPSEAVCRTCHVPPHIVSVDSFVFNDKLKVILGPGHGEKRLLELPQ